MPNRSCLIFCATVRWYAGHTQGASACSGYSSRSHAFALISFEHLLEDILKNNKNLEVYH